MFSCIKNNTIVRLNFISIIIGVLLFSGCNSKYKKNTEQFESNIYSAKQIDSYAFYGEDISPEKEKELLAENIIYFGYDRDDITNFYQLALLAHAKRMIEKPQLKLRIIGHTDERGSPEYNIGLGERRAKSVARFIQMKGISSDRIVTISYGKEKPAAMGSNEEAWRLNRRAELDYYE